MDQVARRLALQRADLLPGFQFGKYLTIRLVKNFHLPS